MHKSNSPGGRVSGSVPSSGCTRCVVTGLHQSGILPRSLQDVCKDDILSLLDAEGVEFAISVPSESLITLKELIENRKRWLRLNGQRSFFERKAGNRVYLLSAVLAHNLSR